MEEDKFSAHKNGLTTETESKHSDTSALQKIKGKMEFRGTKIMQMVIIYSIVVYLGYCEETGKSATKYIDLTHPFNNKTLYWPTFKTFSLDIQFRDVTDSDFWFEANNFAAAEHGGTHMDAPSHFAKGKWRMGQIPIDLFFGEAVVVDITAKSKENRDAELEVDDLKEWELKYGRIPDRSYVFMYSGWDERWDSELLYVGNTVKDTNDLHFPGINANAAVWLLQNRNITAIGVDTASIDHGPSRYFPAHRFLYDHNKLGLENVNNLKLLPAKGAKIYAFPMKIEDGSGAPCRLIAEISGSGPMKGWTIWIGLAILSLVIILF